MADFRTFNTAIEGQPLIAATNGLDIRALQFTNFLKQLPPMTGTSSYSDQSRLYVNEMMQASVGHFLVYAATGDNQSVSSIYVGPDTPEQASNYHALFNLQDTSDVRVLDFVKFNGSVPTDGAGAVLLSNDGATTSNCVTVNGLPSANLFEASAAPGTRTLVLVKRTSPTGVNFAIMPGCCEQPR